MAVPIEGGGGDQHSFNSAGEFTNFRDEVIIHHRKVPIDQMPMPRIAKTVDVYYPELLHVLLKIRVFFVSLLTFLILEA